MAIPTRVYGASPLTDVTWFRQPQQAEVTCTASNLSAAKVQKQVGMVLSIVGSWAMVLGIRVPKKLKMAITVMSYGQVSLKMFATVKTRRVLQAISGGLGRLMGW